MTKFYLCRQYITIIHPFYCLFKPADFFTENNQMSVVYTYCLLIPKTPRFCNTLIYGGAARKQKYRTSQNDRAYKHRPPKPISFIIFHLTVFSKAASALPAYSAERQASSNEFASVPTSSSIEPVVRCSLYFFAASTSGRARPGYITSII